MEESAVPQSAGMPVPRGDPKLACLQALEGTGEIEEVKSVTSRQRANQFGDHGALALSVRTGNDHQAERNSGPVCFLAPARIGSIEQGFMFPTQLPPERIGAIGSRDSGSKQGLPDISERDLDGRAAGSSGPSEPLMTPESTEGGGTDIDLAWVIRAPPPLSAALGRDVVSIRSLLLCRKGLQSLPEPRKRIGGVGRADQIA
jgi:hypothetical protein